MRWEDVVLGLFADLEQQAEGLALEERAATVGELGVAEYASVTLASRLHASVELDLRLWLRSGAALLGRLEAAGSDWCLLVDDAGSEWMLPHGSLTRVDGLSRRSVNEQAWSIAARLGVRSVLRRLAGEGTDCVVHLDGDARVEGRLARIGHDLVEIVQDDRLSVLPLSAVVAVQGRR